MSTVLELDGTTHVVRYGMHDDKKEKCYVWFFRNGKRFIMDVSGDDVRGTSFYEMWRPLIEEVDPRTPAGRNFLDRWRDLATCVITAGLPKLRELAPDTKFWTTLGDYLHTPSYRFRVLKQDGSENGVAAEVTEGSEDIPAYEFKPYAMDMFGGLPDSIPKIEAHQLTVLDREKNWRVPPHKVKTTNGQIARFKGCEKPARFPDSDELQYHSRDSIKCSLRLHETTQKLKLEAPLGLPEVLCIVTDVRAEKQGSPEQLVAGILISWTGSDTIWDLVRDADAAAADNILQRSAAWRTRIENVLKALHAVGLSFCGSDGKAHISIHSVYIDENEEAWLPTDSSFVSEPRDGEEHDACVAADMKAVKELFEEWLPAELAKEANKRSPVTTRGT